MERRRPGEGPAGAFLGCPETQVQRVPDSAWRVTRGLKRMPWIHSLLYAEPILRVAQATQPGQGRASPTPSCSAAFLAPIAGPQDVS